MNDSLLWEFVGIGDVVVLDHGLTRLRVADAGCSVDVVADG